MKTLGLEKLEKDEADRRSLKKLSLIPTSPFQVEISCANCTTSKVSGQLDDMKMLANK
jgi:hypothetical protein